MRFALATLVFATGTWLVGWWAVPVLALMFGVAFGQPAIAAAAAATSWLILLIIDAAGGSITRLAAALAGVMGIPSPALVLVTLLFPALVAWGAAALGDTARSVRATSRQPS